MMQNYKCVTHSYGFTPKPRGLTLIEAMVAMVIFTAAAIAVYSGFTSSYTTAKRSRASAEGVLRVAHHLEDIQLMAYYLVNTNYFPIRYVTDHDGLVYAMTTRITRSYFPYDHKKVQIDYTWRVGNHHRHSQYFYIKAP